MSYFDNIDLDIEINTKMILKMIFFINMFFYLKIDDHSNFIIKNY
jgi:hypothetical protein